MKKFVCYVEGGDTHIKTQARALIYIHTCSLSFFYLSLFLSFFLFFLRKKKRLLMHARKNRTLPVIHIENFFTITRSTSHTISLLLWQNLTRENVEFVEELSICPDFLCWHFSVSHVTMGFSNCLLSSYLFYQAIIAIKRKKIID
jgi:hypothetical protein